jgi:Flp pilus assembly pilin Flp
MTITSLMKKSGGMVEMKIERQNTKKRNRPNLKRVLHRTSGHTLSELGLLLAAIGIVLIGSLSLMGDNVSTMLTNIAGKDGMGDGTTSILAPVSVASAAEADPDQAGRVASPLSEAGLLTEQIMGQYPTDLGKEVMTTGANGTTAKLLATMDAVIQRALEQGTITQDEANRLQALSNKGHEIAEVEAFLENMAKTNPSAMTRPFTYNGVSYPNAQALATQIGFDPNSRREQPMSQQFFNLYMEAVNTGALNDPTLHATIDVLVNQITNVANGVEGSTVMVVKGTISSTQFQSQILGGLGERDRILGTDTQQGLDSIADMTHNDSSDICTAGGGRGNGKSCGNTKNSMTQ